ASPSPKPISSPWNSSMLFMIDWSIVRFCRRTRRKTCFRARRLGSRKKSFSHSHKKPRRRELPLAARPSLDQLHHADVHSAHLAVVLGIGLDLVADLLAFLELLEALAL